MGKELEKFDKEDYIPQSAAFTSIVYTAAFCIIERHQDVRDKIGANDSKQLKEIERERMLKSMEKSEWVGYTGITLILSEFFLILAVNVMLHSRTKITGIFG